MSRYHNLLSVINHLYKGSIQKSLSDWTPFDNPEKILTWCRKWKFKFSSDNQSGMDKFNPPQELHFSGNIKFNPPQELNFSRNNCEHRKLWKQLILYLTATEKTRKSEEVKSSMLLTCIGPRGRGVYNTFVFDDDSMKMKINCILQQFDDYCSPQKMWLSSDTNFSRIDSQRDNVLIILLPNWRSWASNVNFRLYRTRLSGIWELE